MNIGLKSDLKRERRKIRNFKLGKIILSKKGFKKILHSDNEEGAPQRKKRWERRDAEEH